jgi:hypothetical protein
MEGAARLVLLLVAFGIALSYIQRGPGGPLSWVKAKYTGRSS